MNSLKQLALATYYYASLPQRKRQAKQRAASGCEPVSILFYHRVADEHPNAWTMSRQSFARQIEWIESRFDVIDLAEAQRRIAAGENQRPAVCLTFDDGYADNCEFALPLLLRKGLPATYFVTSGHVLSGDPFPHDVAAGVRLRPNTIQEIRAMAGGGIEIGAHTRTHADLGAPQNASRLRDELIGSREDLQQAIGKPVRYFAFPFGLHANLSVEAFRIAHEAGLAGVCSAYGAYNWPGDDPFHLKRIHADPEMLRLKNWLTVDRRKTDMPEFDAGDFRAGQHSSDSSNSALAEAPH